MLKLEEAREALRKFELIKKSGHFLRFKHCLREEVFHAFKYGPLTNRIGLEVWEFQEHWYVIEFCGKFRLTKQGQSSLDVTRLRKFFPRVPLDDFVSEIGSRYVRKRVYTAFPKLCAFMRMNSGMVDDLVAEHFDIMALLTNSDEKVRRCAKRYLDQRHS